MINLYNQELPLEACSLITGYESLATNICKAIRGITPSFKAYNRLRKIIVWSDQM